jgi:hypothetical protein
LLCGQLSSFGLVRLIRRRELEGGIAIENMPGFIYKYLLFKPGAFVS